MNRHSILWPEMERFIAEKRALGYKYRGEEKWLVTFDRFLISVGLRKKELSQKTVEAWIAPRVYQRPKTRGLRLNITVQFARYLLRIGIPAYVAEQKVYAKKAVRDYVPYIFKTEELHHLLCALDQETPHALSPLRNVVYPVIFRLLICTGMRVGEVISLLRRDVDLDHGILTIRNAKFGKDRLIPLAPDMTDLLRKYAETLPIGGCDESFFITGYGRPVHERVVYIIFRRALSRAGISHMGRGRGPRVHDLRHTFAVHSLEKWYRKGEDLSVKLPLLSVYLGHLNLFSTQWYLRLTPSLYPDIIEKLERTLGTLLPRREP